MSAKHIIRRCFMTGKQCIHSGQIENNVTASLNADKQSENINVFMATPFRQHISTCHKWILKPYFNKELKNYHQNKSNNNIEIFY
ncbi:hypothetical protein [Methanobrevibacter curvatus]|uniref:Uncharacterized protein n=1 Tax=Methanobrevibacter curvatus TaxID=49547 RepID=A0A166DJA0_9EURY|nr:hypothetical protein [Methanobrevibacter curvatus]KZX15658.1 hypothetical protein MBCUR_02110 [Methanobrevibacter curvatus]